MSPADPILDSINEGVFTVDPDWRITTLTVPPNGSPACAGRMPLAGLAATFSAPAFASGHAPLKARWQPANPQ